MENIPTYENYLNELNKFIQKYDNIEDIFKILDKLPNTIQYIQIPTSVVLINPSTVKVYPKENKNWKKDIKKHLSKLLKQTNYIETYKIDSFFGKNGNPNTDPYYIQFLSDSIDDVKI